MNDTVIFRWTLDDVEQDQAIKGKPPLTPSERIALAEAFSIDIDLSTYVSGMIDELLENIRAGVVANIE